SATAELRSRATNALRPGVKSRISALIPSFARIPAMYIAGICSFPGGFDVLILMRSASQPCASLAIADVSPFGRGLAGFAGIPGAPAGGTCAAIGKLAAIISAATTTITWTIRFQFTNPSSSSWLAAARPPQQRFASNVLHTNMQVWALGFGGGGALPKFNRWLADRFSHGRESPLVGSF